MLEMQLNFLPIDQKVTSSLKIPWVWNAEWKRNDKLAHSRPSSCPFWIVTLKLLIALIWACNRSSNTTHPYTSGKKVLNNYNIKKDSKMFCGFFFFQSCGCLTPTSKLGNICSLQTYYCEQLFLQLRWLSKSANHDEAVLRRLSWISIKKSCPA